MSASVRYEVAGGLARLILDQPARMNAMTFDMWAAIPSLVAKADADAAARVIVVEGAGDKAFCAGADISQFGEKRTGAEATRAYDEAVSAGMAALAKTGKPSVAVIRGICFGGGFALALSCDIRLARADARFRIPAARLGIGFAYANTESMTRKLGVSAVADILLTARVLDVDDATRVGAVTKAWHPDTFEAEASAYLSAIAANAPLTLRAVKGALAELTKPEAERDRARAEALVAACFDSADYREGQAAFLEKRSPRFQGR